MSTKGILKSAGVKSARNCMETRELRQESSESTASAAMAVELYLDLLSQPCRSVLIFAKKNNIPHEVRNISLMDGEQYGDHFGKISLIRKVPALRDGDFCLTERCMFECSLELIIPFIPQYDLCVRSPAVCFCAAQPSCCIWRRSFRPQSTGTQRTSSSALASMSICPGSTLMIPEVLHVEVPKEKMEAAVEELSGSLKLLEEKFLQDRPFIAGGHISLADLVAIVEVMQPVAAGLDVFGGRPKLNAWRDRVQAAIGKELFDEVHQNILGSQERVKVMDGSKLEFSKAKILNFFM
ncbi:hypothetical protein F7725_005206 [Dissostichus mawsoni]|uniref:Glutathione transferase n=1 Tax=Dissostichus mawsoni TaxID=36200 RepID=A0A7J5YSE2_DISMA|nr:hypothetical protein F7725_005206 [Dissostichus mawsoni]